MPKAMLLKQSQDAAAGDCGGVRTCWKILKRKK